MTRKKKSYIHQCEERDVVAFMREHLADDGLCYPSTEDIGAVVGKSQPTGQRIFKRLREDKSLIWVVVEATSRNQFQSSYGVFPWRNAAQYSKMNPHQLVGTTAGSTSSPHKNTSEDSKMNPSIVGHIAQGHITCDSRVIKVGGSSVGLSASGEYKNQWLMDSKMNPQLVFPPAWALVAQSAFAISRLDELKVLLKKLQAQYGEKDWATPIQTTHARIDDTKAYIADLKLWKILAGVQ
jgi:hypothetical protein